MDLRVGFRRMFGWRRVGSLGSKVVTDVGGGSGFVLLVSTWGFGGHWDDVYWHSIHEMNYMYVNCSVTDRRRACRMGCSAFERRNEMGWRNWGEEMIPPGYVFSRVCGMAEYYQADHHFDYSLLVDDQSR